MDDTQARIAQAIQDGRRPVARAVVDGNQLEIGKRLRQNSVDGLRQIGRAVAYGKNHTYTRARHGSSRLRTEVARANMRSTNRRAPLILSVAVAGRAAVKAAPNSAGSDRGCHCEKRQTTVSARQRFFRAKD